MYIPGRMKSRATQFRTVTPYIFVGEDNIVHKIKRRKPMSKRPTGRPKTLWEDDVLKDVKSINVRNWKKVA